MKSLGSNVENSSHMWKTLQNTLILDWAPWSPWYFWYLDFE